MIVYQILSKNQFLNSKYARSFFDILVFYLVFLLEYAMDVKWKMIGNE